jgi:hypothetical protein
LVTVPPTAQAGYDAFALLAQLDPDTLARLPAGRWRLWTPVLLHHHPGDDPQACTVQQQLLARAYRASPAGFADSAATAINQQAPWQQPPRAAALLAACWDTDLEQRLAAFAVSPTTLPAATGALLGELLSRDAQPAREHTEALLADPAARRDRRDQVCRRRDRAAAHRPTRASLGGAGRRRRAVPHGRIHAG